MLGHGSMNQIYQSVHRYRWNRNLLINSLGLSNLRSFSTSLGDDDAFDTICKKQKGKKVLYFTASWCGPCKAISPVYDSLSKEHPDIQFFKIDVDSLTKTAEAHQIRSIPTFVFMSDAKQVFQFSGASVPLLKENITKLKLV